MSKSNHQKYGFVVRTKGSRRDKSWVKAKDYINRMNRHAKWNGDQFPLLSSDVGRIESVRHIEIGG